MKKIILCMVFVGLMVNSIFAAEFYIYNRPSWMNNLTEKQRIERKITADEFNMRERKGDIVVVKDNNATWSESELPHVVKIPSISYKDAIVFVLPAKTTIGNTTKTTLLHRYKCINKTIIDKLNEKVIFN